MVSHEKAPYERMYENWRNEIKQEKSKIKNFNLNKKYQIVNDLVKFDAVANLK
jgi:hypothetical protein